jgi:hypothetical protein
MPRPYGSFHLGLTSARNRVGGVVAFPASHTTVHAGPHTAVHHPLRIDW